MKAINEYSPEQAKSIENSIGVPEGVLTVIVGGPYVDCRATGRLSVLSNV